MTRVLALTIVLGLAVPARAETRRLAIVVGNNAGDPADPVLHFAETDAGKMAQVLVELGGIDPDDMLLLQGRSLAQLRQAFVVAKQRVRQWHQQPNERAVLVFYFSGHSDGEVLELGPDRLTYGELRRWLTDSQAEVRLAIVDSCHSGALVTTKGASLGPPFEIRLRDDITSTGEAFLTSNAAGETALESSEIQGSFFTHHLVSGLRGAADTSGDGRITLTEAYDYAFAHTVSATSSIPVGEQHPVYDYKLSGEGELVLSELSRLGCALELPDAADRSLITDLIRDRVLAEIVRGATQRVVVPPGEYGVEVWRDGKARGGRFTLKEGQRQVVHWDSLNPMPVSNGVAKGPDADSASSPLPDLEVAIGAGHGVADGLGPVPEARIGLRPSATSGWILSAQAATEAAPGFQETSALFMGGYVGALAWGDLELYGGGEMGGGVIVQARAPERSSGTAAGALAPVVGVHYRVVSYLGLVAEGSCPAALVDLDGKPGVVWLPAAWVGIRTPL